VARDWLAWHDRYADPHSWQSLRLKVVRRELDGLLTGRHGPVRLLSLCSGDARDTLPVLAASATDVAAVLVELDPDLADDARRVAADLGVEVEVRTGDAGLAATWADVAPVDVLMLCGIFGNVVSDGIRRTLDSARRMLYRGGAIIWTRGSGGLGQPDAAEWVHHLLVEDGWEPRAFVRPDDAEYRVGVHVRPEHVEGSVPERLFTFVG
jgi:hypothetical protein